MDISGERTAKAEATADERDSSDGEEEPDSRRLDELAEALAVYQGPAEIAPETLPSPTRGSTR